MRPPTALFENSHLKTASCRKLRFFEKGLLTCLGMGPYKPLHRTRAAALLATVTFALDFFELAAMLIGSGLRVWDGEFRLGYLVCYLTIEDEKKEKRGRRSSRD
ncbi:hypothetical protein [Rhizobium sp. AN80A]|uniref:hypothetical protein n=1 Tax=Rhizobium sp. AN80A TaxID=3040673 RepID=UPI0024B34112|nr:hypothetical protein [Rhizobium sp. AN80A]